jgi:hypothetical protein
MIMRMCVVWACMFVLTGVAFPRHATAALPQAVPLHVLKIAAGPGGSASNGTFVLTEERSAFNRMDDREVIVSFDWEGIPGAHKLVALWRSQDGSVTSTSSMDYIAKGRRFGAYWRLTLSPTAPIGTWSIEATVDGQPGGRFTFEITDTKVQPVEAVKVKTPLAQSELYERLGRMFVGIERFSSTGRTLDAVSGVLGAKGRIYTAMAAIDDVDRIRAVLPDGSTRDLQTLFAWNRRQDWAVLEATNARELDLPVAASGSVKIGDRCFSIEGSPSAGGVLVDLSVIGHRAPPDGGWLATFVNGFGTPGAPVVNEYGELLGIVGASPGATRMGVLLRNRAELKGVPIVPFGLFRVNNDVVPTRIADLRSRGELIAALAGDQNVLSGGFAREIARTNTVAPSDQRDEFSATEKKMVAFVTWNPVEKLKGLAIIRLFDVDNRLVMETKPMKLSLGKGQMSLSSWELPISSLSGTYRADVMLDARPMWRGFVKITP